MVHNGIEYGVMAAYAEGLNILKSANAGKHTHDADAETAPLREPEFYQYDMDLPQIALSEDFGINGRSTFYESAGCLRDVIQNHLCA
jgi:6-phosphogluconate dehydrogenase (decarboxylating)